MRLFEAIIDANHRAVAGDPEAGLHPADFADELPVIALTCIDPRLNAYFPNALALPAEQFIWLRNAGNIIFDPMSSMTRTLALACAVKGGREIAIIGHTDCQVRKTTAMQLLNKFKELGVDRHQLPGDLTEFFGLFSSERQNVIKACDIVRHSPLIGPKIPVHGLLLNTETGELDWLVNGYQTLEAMGGHLNEPIAPAGPMPDILKSLPAFQMGEMKFPESRIGESGAKIGTPELKIASTPPVQPVPAGPVVPPKIPLPPPLRPKIVSPRGRR